LKYREIILGELKYINKNSSKIVKNAKIVYSQKFKNLEIGYIKNTVDFKLLEDKIKNIMSKNNLKNVIIGMEPTGSYGSALIKFLINAGFYVVNVMSNHVKKAKELDDNTPTKNDRKDALTIANLIKEGRYHDIYIPKGTYADLRILTTNRQEWIRNKVHCNNKIICILDQYFPEFQSVFKDISGKSSMKILSKYPLPEDVLSVDIETLRDNTKICDGKRRISKNKIVALYTFAQNTIGITNDVSYIKTNINFLINLGVRDSKKITDDKIKKIAPDIIKKIPYSTFILTNTSYNKNWSEDLNMNKIKAILHNKVLCAIKNKNYDYDKIVVDQFVYPKKYYEHIKDATEKVTDITFMTKAEDQCLSVAAASIISRYIFLGEMKKLSEQTGIEIPKGAGPNVDEVGIAIAKEHGFDKLKDIAKLNFKNKDKIKAGLKK